ncbi:MAG: hypothetical protein HKN45_11335 [Flavobacteriales bacterium]|nr:hypothetical protein [Flavobacteriales bacterium]
MTLCGSCEEKEVDDCGGTVDLPVYEYGSAYIGCEMEPFFILISDLSDCVTFLPLDSINSADWSFGCEMNQLETDSSSADLRISYLQSGTLEILLLDSSLLIDNWVPEISGEEIAVHEHPFYGAFTIQAENMSIDILLLNRYIGGCFHDELIWRIGQ